MARTQKEIFEETISKLKEIRDECDIGKELKILKEMTDELSSSQAKDFLQGINERIEQGDKKSKEWATIRNASIIKDTGEARKIFEDIANKVNARIQNPGEIPAEILLAYGQILMASWMSVGISELGFKAAKKTLH